MKGDKGKGKGKRGKEWKKEEEERKEGKGRKAGTFCVQQSPIPTGPRNSPAATPSIPGGNILGSRS